MQQERLGEAAGRLKQLFQSHPELQANITSNLTSFITELQMRNEDGDFGSRTAPGRATTELERKRVGARLHGFNVKASMGWQAIAKHFGEHLTQTELLSVAQVIGNEVGIKIDREAKRRKEVLVKWFDENYEHVREVLPRITLEDECGRRVDPTSTYPD
jgi:hypothetical protein